MIAALKMALHRFARMEFFSESRGEAIMPKAGVSTLTDTPRYFPKAVYSKA
jgi:hypothetical protein